MARIVANDRFVTVAMAGARSAVARALADVADREIARVQTTHHPSHTDVFVDGRQGVPLEAVRRTIHARFSYMGKIVEAGLGLLYKTSPVLSGDYQSEHRAFVNGEATTDPGAIARARRVIISNDSPYARVIEIGKRGRAPWSQQPQVPRAGVYRSAARELRRRFGHLATIEFSWVGLDSGSTLGGAAGNASSLRYPCITIEARQ